MQIIDDYTDFIIVKFIDANGYTEIPLDRLRRSIHDHLSSFYNQKMDELGYDQAFRKMIGSFYKDLEDIEAVAIRKELHDMAIEISKNSKE